MLSCKAKRCSRSEIALTWNKVGPTGPQAQPARRVPKSPGGPGMTGATAPSDGHFNQASRFSISLSMSDMDVGSVNVTAASYMGFGAGRLRNTTSGTSNADCDHHNMGAGSHQPVNVHARVQNRPKRQR
jgi:hypothetical protein